MIIVVFHMLYLLGKFVYYRVRKEKPVDDGVNSARLKALQELYTMIDPEALQDHKDTLCVVKFVPPAYIQRYIAVSNVLNSAEYQGKLRKVVDFGCSELGFLIYLKKTEGIEEILCVDIDRELLEIYKDRARPLTSEFINVRETPLVIEICEGSITHKDKKLEKTDAVICIELIEHLYPETLENFPRNVFGYIKPKVAIVTTPNADFNELFPNLNGFRHPDHKFEWTRAEFQEWAENIVLNYPEYKVTFHGICYGPEITKHLGACSQMAVFHRQNENDLIHVTGVEGLFKTVATHEYPFNKDNRSDEQKILDEALYVANRSFYESAEIPLDKIVRSLEGKFHITTDLLKTILRDDGWTIETRENGPVLIMSNTSDLHDDVSEEDFEDNYSSMGDEDGWNIESNVPEDYCNKLIRDPFSEDWFLESWDEESSIIVPKNTSFTKDNTYLFDGENAILDPDGTSEDATTGTLYDNAESRCSERELPSNSISLISNHVDVDKVEEQINFDIPLSLNASYERLEDDNNKSYESTKGVNRMLDFGEYLSVSRSSTSPQPYVPAQLDCSQDNSMVNNQNWSDAWTLNSTFREDDSLKISHIDDDTSVGSIYLNPSRDEQNDHCLETVTDTLKNVGSSESNQSNSSNTLNTLKQRIQFDEQLDAISLTSINNCVLDNKPQFTSSPRISTKGEASETQKSDMRSDEQISGNAQTNTQSLKQSECTMTNVNSSEITSQMLTVSLYENSIPSTLNSTCNVSKNTTEKRSQSPMRTISPLNNENKTVIQEHTLSASTDDIEFLESDSKHLSKCSETGENAQTTSIKKMKLLNLNPSESNSKDLNSIETYYQKCAKANNKVKNHTAVPCSYHKSQLDLQSATEIESVQVRPYPPDPPETPPNSWSPEIMDSGYPNSASAQDMTPEYDLSSIAQDHISDSESPSVAEAPRFGIVEAIEVENGDLANNNRDGEGNNMIAPEDMNDLENLQPLIDVLENDLENDNDIYVLENGFPIWLLRILEMANPIDFEGRARGEAPYGAGGDAGYVDHDEGIDSSSEDDSDVDDNEMINRNLNINANVNKRDAPNDIDNDSESEDATESMNGSCSDTGSDQWATGDT